MGVIIDKVKSEVSKVVVGQQNMIDALFIGLLSDGHILLEGVPGLAKTTTVKALASALNLEFKRVQFTPDLLPSDIIGAEIYDPKESSFKIKHGPVFTNLLLADEINRAPAKVQSALLEVMQEHQVTIGEDSFKVDEPFVVMATQNPVEQEGAYQLPEAQLDRFMLKIVVGYNTEEEELEIAIRQAKNKKETISAILGKADLEELKNQVANIHIDEELEKYIVQLIFATRECERFGLEEIKSYIRFGASPRATIDMLKASRAHAFLRGNDHVSPVDIAMVAHSVLRHRIMLSYEAEANQIEADYIIDKILEAVSIP